MTEVEYEIQKLERQIKADELKCERASKIRRLMTNKDFIDVVIDGWGVTEAAAYAKQAGDTNMSKESREDSMAQAMAAGYLERFLSAQLKLGDGSVERGISELKDRVVYMKAHGTIEGFGEEMGD